MEREKKSELVGRISKALHGMDPMNTYCSSNMGMDDEYLSEAEAIINHLDNGCELRDAVRNTFDARFWEGCLTEPTRECGLEAVVGTLQHILKPGS